MDCLFCKLIERQIPADILYEDDEIIAFNDIQPQAACHFLVVPKKHISTLNDIEMTDVALIGKIVKTAADIAKTKGFDTSGYRTVFNCNKDAGQVVFHIHLHVLAGQPLGASNSQ